MTAQDCFHQTSMPWTLAPATPQLVLDQSTQADGRQVSLTGLVHVSGLEAGSSWQYSLDGGTTWMTGQGTALQLSGPELTA
jgi:hypothetical protein